MSEDEKRRLEEIDAENPMKEVDDSDPRFVFMTWNLLTIMFNAM